VNQWCNYKLKTKSCWLAIFLLGLYESSKGKDPWYPARGAHPPSLPAHVAVDSGRMLEYHFQSRTSTDGVELRAKEWLAQWVVSGWWGDMDFFVVSLRWQILRKKTILWIDAIKNAKNMGHLRIFWTCFFLVETTRSEALLEKQKGLSWFSVNFGNYHWPKLIYLITPPTTFYASEEGLEHIFLCKRVHHALVEY